MAPDGIGGPWSVDGAVGQIIADLARSFPHAGSRQKSLNGPFDPDDGRDGIPPGGNGEDGGSIEDSCGACFVSVTLMLVDGLERRAWISFAAAGFDLMVEAFLVRLQLDDQMDIRLSGYGKGFFGSAWRRA